MDTKPFDVVAILQARKAEGLVRGPLGTGVERLAPGVFEVEFSDNLGRTYASVALKASELLVLHHDLNHAA
ncbi:MAG TPA: DUF4926 domain-containing protein [Terriglobia bacterium]|nr:DUF4926 domain-containing protein [Terriglobia bacterium]